MLTAFRPSSIPTFFAMRMFAEAAKPASPAIPKVPTEEKKQEKPPKPTYEDIEKQLDKTKKELENMKNETLYLMADIKNLQRIHSEELQEFRQVATGALAGELLPVVDNLERMVQVGKKQTVDDLLDGVKMVISQFLASFKKYGITQINPINQKFDPRCHTALATLDFGGKVPSGNVADVSLTGYLIGKKVLRHAKVAVAK